MYVTAEDLSVAFVLDQNRTEATLKQWAGSLVATVEEADIARLEGMHSLGQVGLWSAEKNVEVIVEQGIRKDSPSATCRMAIKEPQPILAVIAIEHDVTPFQAPLCDVIHTLRKIESWLPWHEQSPPIRGKNRNRCLTPDSTPLIPHAICSPPHKQKGYSLHGFAGTIECHERLGGLLRYYFRKAA